MSGNTSITVGDIHQVLDCDGLSAKEIEQDDRNTVHSEISKLIVRERNVSQEVADDFTRHYVDDENSHKTVDHFLAMFDDLLAHIANDKHM